MKLLWVTPKWPLPVEDGARQATYQLLKNLSSLGADIHLCSIVPENELDSCKSQIDIAKSKLGVRDVSVFPRPPSRHFRTALSNPIRALTTALTIAPYCARSLTHELGKLALAETDRVLVFDGLHAAGWWRGLPANQRRRVRTVYRAHNVESDLWVRSATQGQYRWLAPLLAYQGRLVREFEGWLCKEAELVATVSQTDLKRFRKVNGEMHAESLPIGISFPERSTEFPKAKNLLFLGKLDWKPNRDGLRWFLQNVWPEAARKDPEVHLTIAGAGDGAWLEEFIKLPRVKFLGRVPEVAPVYQDSIASLVPIFFGSGTRVKAIEASSFARPCISTAIGVEGIGLDPNRSYFQAESKEEWIRLLGELTLEEAEHRGLAAQSWIQEEFNPTKIAQRFLDLMTSTPSQDRSPKSAASLVAS